MFSGDSKNILMPFLLNIVNGSENELSLNPTSFFQATSFGKVNSYDINKPLTNEVVAVIQVHHPIFKYDQFCGPKGTQSIIQILENWKADENIVAVVMDYNSGGGQASGTRETARYIFQYPKPIVSYTNDTCGSAAFYMYAAAKYRFINQYADFIGCIGSMWYNIDLEGALEKSGAKVNELYSDLSEEKNHQSRELKKGNERPLVEKILNPNAEIFHSDIKEFQPSITEKALKGDVFSPEEAIKEGLVDAFGTRQDAIDKAWELHNESKKSNKSNSNTNTMQTKQLPKLQAVLGLTAALATTDNGSFLNAEQLDNLENRFDELETSNSTLQTQLTEAQNNTALQTELTAATGTITSLEASINSILEEAGVTATGTAAEKLTALSAKVTEMAGKDGGVHTHVRVDNTPPKQKAMGFDANASHNQMANEIFNK